MGWNLETIPRFRVSSKLRFEDKFSSLNNRERKKERKEGINKYGRRTDDTAFDVGRKDVVTRGGRGQGEWCTERNRSIDKPPSPPARSRYSWQQPAAGECYGM